MSKLSAGGNSPDPALKKAIIAAARELFVEYGFSRIKMDDVARKLGISKKTLYIHFPSKEKLFSASLITTLDGWKKDYSGIVSGSKKNCVAKLEEISGLISRCYSMLSRPMADDLPRFAPAAWKAIEEWRKTLIFTELAALMDEGKKQGYFHADTDKELGLILYYEFSRSVLTPDFVTRYPYSAGQVSAAVSRLFFSRLLTEKGKALLKEKL